MTTPDVTMPTPDVTMAPPDVILLCLIEGTSSTFTVSVSLDKDILYLKKAVKAERANQLKDFDSHDLTLFQVCHLPTSVQLVAQQLDRSMLISTTVWIFNPSKSMISKFPRRRNTDPSPFIGVRHLKTISMS